VVNIIQRFENIGEKKKGGIERKRKLKRNEKIGV